MFYRYVSTKVIPLGSCAFRQPQALSHCRFLHGYRLQGKFWFTADTLDENNWVVDFGIFKGLRLELEHQFDHTTVISSQDPEMETFKLLAEKKIIDLRVMDSVGIEMFARFCQEKADAFVKNLTNFRCECTKAEVWEHEGNSAIYEVKPENYSLKDVRARAL